MEGGAEVGVVAGEQLDGGDAWRIDELARRSGATVDTIRFYQREGLLPPAERQGRTLLYGPEHLERLERIRDLQSRHFTLKAIRALAEEGRLQILDRLFGAEDRTYRRAELARESGLGDEFVRRLEEIGLLGRPELHGALHYDGDDLAVLSALKGSIDRGMPEAVALLLARMYHDEMGALRDQIFRIFSVGGTGLGAELSDDDLDAFRTLAANDIDAFLEDSCILLEYLHRRGVQRLVVQAMEWANNAADDTPPPGDGG
ncbi:MAG: MerR family transcriptional regulator [Acidimicrobiales bacterium]